MVKNDIIKGKMLKRGLFLLPLFIYVCATLFTNVPVAEAANADSGKPYAQCYVSTGGDGLRKDGNCKATYTYSTPQGPNTVTMNNPPGGDFNDDYGNCYIVNYESKNYEDKSCDELERRSAIWLNPSGTHQDVIESIDWANRIEIRAPTRIRDKLTGINYGVVDIFGNETSAFLNDGMASGNDALYFYAPLNGADPVYIKDGKCYPGFRLRLGANGQDAALSAWLPRLAFSGTSCEIVAEKTIKNGRYSETDEVVALEFHIGSWGGSDMDGVNYGLAMDGDDAKWRGMGAALFWIDNGHIGAFDDKNRGDGFTNFTPLTGAGLDNAKADWETNPTSNLSDAEVKASGWKFFGTTSCTNAYLAVSSDNSAAYPVKADDGVKRIDQGPFDQCVWGRDVDGVGGDAFSMTDKPTYLAFTEKATLPPGSGDDADLGGTGSNVDPTLPEEAKPDVCTTNGGILSWIVCPILDMLDEATIWMEDKVGDFLFIEPTQFDKESDSGANIYRAWSTFRSIATVIIVIIALIMIFSEAMGSGIFDNYSVKKLLPRLLFAGIGIQLSWFAMTQLINIFNIVGDGIGNLMLQPFVLSDGTHLSTNTHITELFAFKNLSTGGKGIFAGMVVAGSIALVAGAVALGIAVVAAMFTGFVTLIIRSIIIFLGVVFAPIAIAMSVLPGTQKTSKWWWESFEKALLMYPIVIALLAAGKITGYLLMQSAQTSDGLKSLQAIAAIVAWFAPFFFLPKALQATGQALGKVTGFANDKSKGMFDRARKWDTDRKGKMRDIKTNQALAKGGIRAGFVGFKTGNFGGIRSGTRAATRMARDQQRGEAMQKDAQLESAQAYSKKRGEEIAQLKALGIYDPKIHGTGNLVLDQANLKADQIQANARAFDLEAAKAEMKIKEGKIAADQASAKLANQFAATGRVWGDGSQVALEYAKAPAGPAGDAHRSAVVGQLIKLGADEDMRKLITSGQLSGEDLASWQQSGDWVGAFKDKAPDLVKGNWSSATTTGTSSGAFAAGKVPETAKMHGWSADTFKAALQDNADVAGRSEFIQAVAQRAATDPDFAATLTDVKKQKVIQDAMDAEHVRLGGAAGTGPRLTLVQKASK